MNIDYIVSIDVNGLSGKEKASREKAKFLKKLSTNFRLFSIKRETKLLKKIFSIIILEFKYVINSFFCKQRPDIIFCRSYLGIGPLFISNIYGIKLIHEVHADLLDEAKILYKNQKFKIKLFEYLNRISVIIYNRSWGLIFNNKLLEKHYKSYYDLNKTNTISINNGCDVDTFYPKDVNETKQRLGLDLENDYLIFIGRISKWHGLEYALDMFKYLSKKRPQTNLLVVGNSHNKFYLDILKKEYIECKQIIFVGGVNQDKAINYINSSLAVLVPVDDIRVSPGSPLKLFDSIACGKPIITQQNTIGYSDIIDTYHLGLSTNYLKPRIASDKINEFLDTLGKNDYKSHNRLIAKTHFNWETIIQKWLIFTKKPKT
jgi:glycosyltransferase involved in cell wall biosynthesis